MSTETTGDDLPEIRVEAYAFDRGFGRVIGRPLRFGLGAVHDVLNVIIVEPRMITTEKVHSIGYRLNRAEIAFVFCFEKQIGRGAFKHFALL